MTKLSNLGRPIAGRRHGWDKVSEADHFHPCPVCGQAVDWRDLRQVIWHDRLGHRRLKLNS